MQSSSVIRPVRILFFFSIFLSLSFNGDTFNHSWCQVISWDCCLIFHNWSKRWIWYFSFYSFAQGVDFLAVQYPQMNSCLSNPFGSNFWQPKHCTYFTSFFRAVHPLFSAFIGFRYFAIELLITNQVLLLFVILSSSGRVCFACCHFLSCPTIFTVSFYFHLHHMNLSILNLNEFFKNIFSISVMDHRWPGMGAMGLPWPSMGPLGKSWPSENSTGVSVRAHLAADSKPHRFHDNCEEKLLWRLRNLLSKFF